VLFGIVWGIVRTLNVAVFVLLVKCRFTCQWGTHMSVGDPHFWLDIHSVCECPDISRHDTEHLLAEFMDADDYP
jgi:hypothetical protein